MSTLGNGGPDQVQRISRIDANHNYEEHHDGRKRRKVSYQGRSWEESEDDLPLQPSLQENKKPKNEGYMYPDQVLLEKAEKLYNEYITLEDKIASLIFFETQAYYDRELQTEIEEYIQKWKIGGLLFTEGDYKRQLYLVEHYQKLSSIPLLMGNDFFHSLGFYFKDDSIHTWGIDKMDAKYFADLGKACVSQNRRLGIQFQLAEKRGGEEAFFTHFSLNDDQIKAFRKGIRDAKGILGLFGQEKKKYASTVKKSQPLFSGSFLLSGGEVREIFSLKTLTFLDLSSLSRDNYKEKLSQAFKNNSYDAFIFSPHGDMIDMIATAIRKGIITERDLEKKLMKILSLKALL